MIKQNWFSTLNESLNSENLIQAWEYNYPPIAYGETFSWTWNDGSKYGHYISIYRNSNGDYERPVHYQR